MSAGTQATAGLPYSESEGWREMQRVAAQFPPAGVDYDAAASALERLNRQAVAGFRREEIAGVARIVVDAALAGREGDE